MKELRELDEKVFGVKEAWLNSVDKAKRIISERFSWMSLKEVPLKEFGCVSEYEIKHFKRHVNQMFGKFSHTCHGRRSILKRNTTLFRKIHLIKYLKQ